MLLPLSTDRPLRRPTLVNHALVAINIAVFVIGSMLERTDPETFERLRESLWLYPGGLTLSNAWTLITYAFLHAGLMHLLGNMVFLFVFGPNVEDRLGRIGYLIFYLLGAAAAGGLHAVFEHSPVVGASGAVAAVTGAYLVLFPRTQIKTLFFLTAAAGEIPAWWFIGGQIVWNIWLHSAGGGRIATLAHLGGYGYGFAIAMALLGTGILHREVYDLFTIFKQAKRRREFREVSAQRERAAAKGLHPDQALKKKNADEETTERVAAARGEVSSRLGNRDIPGAISAYKTLLNDFLNVPGAALMSRNTQYELAGALYAAGEHATAARACELFLEGYPRDPEAPTVRLMLGVICARYLNDPVRARQELTPLTGIDTLEDSHRQLARDILAELG